MVNLFFSIYPKNENLIQHGIIRNEAIPWGVEVHIYVSTHVGTYSTKLETYLNYEVWCKKFPNADGY
jgi:hypothetical protein